MFLNVWYNLGFFPYCVGLAIYKSSLMSMDLPSKIHLPLRQIQGFLAIARQNPNPREFLFEGVLHACFRGII